MHFLLIVLLFVIGASQSLAQGSAESVAKRAERAAIEASARKAAVLYPTCTAEGSPLFVMISKTVAWLEKNNPKFLHNPDWPLMVTIAAAEELKTAAGAKQNGPAATYAPRNAFASEYAATTPEERTAARERREEAMHEDERRRAAIAWEQYQESLTAKRLERRLRQLEMESEERWLNGRNSHR